ncbi:hypothetical protein E2320_006528 [Naja naja]|nr:hypothetical protein E2320_006528 [Naja naja]
MAKKVNHRSPFRRAANSAAARFSVNRNPLPVFRNRVTFNFPNNRTVCLKIALSTACLSKSSLAVLSSLCSNPSNVVLFGVSQSEGRVLVLLEHTEAPTPSTWVSSFCKESGKQPQFSSAVANTEEPALPWPRRGPGGTI